MAVYSISYNAFEESILFNGSQIFLSENWGVVLAFVENFKKIIFITFFKYIL